MKREDFLELSSQEAFTFVGQKLKKREWTWRHASDALRAWKEVADKKEAMSDEQIEEIMNT